LENFVDNIKIALILQVGVTLYGQLVGNTEICCTTTEYVQVERNLNSLDQIFSRSEPALPPRCVTTDIFFLKKLFSTIAVPRQPCQVCTAS
jgi:hypothetical protein